MEDSVNKIQIENLSFSYGNHKVLDNITANFSANKITAIVGSSGTGKSSFLTILNRLWEHSVGAKIEGSVLISLDDAMVDIYKSSYPAAQLRRKVAMVFQNPNPLPMSIFKNVAFPFKLVGFKDKELVQERVEDALKKAFLWDEVKDRLNSHAFSLSGGQQQRLCIARSLIMGPEVLLLDEPTSSLDPRAVGVIEELLLNLKDKCTLIIVSHYMNQVKRIADQVMELRDMKFIKQ